MKRTLITSLTASVLTLMSLTVHAQVHFPDPVQIDSSLYVKDSVVFEKNLLIEQNVKVKGTGVFTGQLKAKDELKVLGTTKMKGDAFVEGEFKLKLFNDPLAESHRMLAIAPNGKTKLLTRDELLTKSTNADCFTLTDGSGSGGAVTAPTWASAATPTYGILSTGSGCPARVGIGTPAPLFELDVRGGGIFSSALGIGVNYQFSGTQLLVESSDQVGICVNSNYTTDWGYALKTVVDRDATKAIGVYSVVANEDVFRVMGDGKLWATEINVFHYSNFPDYVFADDYTLLPLPELELFINEHKHLPNIPSAEEVAEEGLNVGEVQVKQMEKIEELTLYVIELNKQIEALRAELETLKSN